MRAILVSALTLLAVAAIAQPPKIYGRSALLGLGGVVSDEKTTTGGSVSTAMTSPFSSCTATSGWGQLSSLAMVESTNDPQYRSQQIISWGLAEYWDLLTFTNPALTGQRARVTYKVRVNGSMMAQGGVMPEWGYTGNRSATAIARLSYGEAAHQTGPYSFSTYGDGTTNGTPFMNETLEITEEFVYGEPFHMRLYLYTLARTWADLPGQAQSRAEGIQFLGISKVESMEGAPLTYSVSSVSGTVWGVSSPVFDFTLNKSTVAGQNYVQGNLTLGEPAASNLTFTTYDDSSLVTTPANVVINSGQTTKLFAIQVAAVNSPINTTIYAKRGVVTRSAPLTLTPLVPTALAFTPSTVAGGNEVLCRVVINGVAGPGGRTIAVFDNSPFTTMPSTVTVPPGANQVTFPITTTAVTSQKVVTLTARVSAGEKTGTFRINP